VGGDEGRGRKGNDEDLGEHFDGGGVVYVNGTKSGKVRVERRKDERINRLLKYSKVNMSRARINRLEEWK
jgi:hypothetical protein